MVRPNLPAYNEWSFGDTRTTPMSVGADVPDVGDQPHSVVLSGPGQHADPAPE
jgi:hypothetical protein